MYGKCKYITPERAGSLVYEAGIEQNLTTNLNWLSSERRKNQSVQFRQQSVAQYGKLETIVLREIETTKRGDFDYKFDLYVDKINFVRQYRNRRHETTFKIFKKGTETELTSNLISSGESELISLAIECLTFSKECMPEKFNVLFLDEPDVHLHPDLQVRLMQFLKQIVSESPSRILIATHSTALLGTLESYEDVHIGLRTFEQKDIEFKPVTSIFKKILPVFGAYPLSNLFNEAPIFLVEGEDDERIWQQAVRSSNGRLRIYPCSVDGIGNLNDLEEQSKISLRLCTIRQRGIH
jgi:hypothetical protein